jgi:hypothetical protein
MPETALADTTIRHPLFERALAQCREFLGSPSDLAFLFVVGAAGAGKTHLLRLLYGELLAAAAVDMERDPDLIPVLFFNAPAPVDGTFRWRAFGQKLFDAARMPARGWPSQPRYIAVDPIAVRARAYGKTIDDILAEAVQACRDRGVRVIILDEAGHVASVAHARRYRQQLDVMKSVALEAGVRFVLAGPYELLDFRDASAQLGRRSRLVHIAPYAPGIPRERTAFVALARQMLGLVGLDLRSDVDWPSILFDGSLGCVGLLRDWLVEAEHACHSRDGASTFEECIAEFRRSPGQLQKISAELREGMQRLAADAGGGSAPALAKPRPRPTTLNGQRLKPGEAKPRRRFGPDLPGDAG